MDEFHPRGVAVQGASRGFLIGESGEPSQVTPVGAGRIATIAARQVPAGRGRHSRFQRRGTEANPSLQMAGAGLHDHTRIMPVGAHAVDGRRIRMIQIDENIAGVLVAGVGLNIDVTTLAVASAQKADRSGAGQLGCGPEPFAGKRPTSLVVNQTDQVELVGHCRQLPANGLPSEKETAVFHDRNFAVGTNRRTMNLSADGELCLNCLSQPRGQVHMLLVVNGERSHHERASEAWTSRF